MKHVILAITLLAAVLLVACAAPPATPTETITTNTVEETALPTEPPQITVTSTDEEAEIRDLVENFGKRLQNVSLLSPTAAQDIQKEYSEFVSPALLETWMSDVSKAPGRMVSSPWPDRIEITTLTKEGSDRYVITGFVIEVTSVEVNSGGAAAKIPVRVVVQKDQGHWLITEYTEQR